jgi:hypothetical protein
LLALFLLVAARLPASASAMTVYANSSADLVSAWNLGSSPMTIVLLPGTYTLSVPLVLDSARTVHLTGDSMNTTVISGNWSTRLFEVMPKTTLVLQDLTVQHGNASAPNPGADYYGLGGGCVAVYGTVVYALTASTFQATRVKFAQCISQYDGGAVGFWGSVGSTLLCDGCMFLNNSARNGGALFFAISQDDAGSMLSFASSQFLDNSAASSGGACYFEDGGGSANTLDRCTFTRNYAGARGGAIANIFTLAPLQAFRCTFVANDCFDTGYAIDLKSLGQLQVDNSTAFFDHRGFDGGLNSTSGLIAAGDFATQVAVVPLPTPMPTQSPTTGAPLTPFAPTTTQAPTPRFVDTGGNVGLIAAVATGVTAILLSAAVFAAWIVYGRRNRTQFVQQEQQHVAFMRRRARAAQRPLIVHIGTQLKPDEPHETCPICMSDAAPPSVVSRAAPTLSAAGAGLTTPQLLGTTFVRLGCEHAFHSACIIEWCEVYDNETCPVCRTICAVRKAPRGSSTDNSSQPESFSRRSGSWLRRSGSNRTMQRPGGGSNSAAGALAVAGVVTSPSAAAMGDIP